MNRKHALALLVCVCCPLMMAASCTLTISTPESATSTETQNVTMPADSLLVVSNELGSTSVTVDQNATQATIQIVRVAYAESQGAADALLAEMDVAITQPTPQDNKLQITAQVPPGATNDTADFNMVVSGDDIVIRSILGNGRVAKYRLLITLPPGHGVQVAQDVGLVRATGLDTSSTLTGRAASIRVSAAQAAVSVETTSGDVNVISQAGTLQATVHVGSLSIDVASLAADESITGHVDSGSLDIDLPANINADLQAAATVGLVSFRASDFLATTVDVKTISYVKATLNAGGATVDLSNETGTIAIRGN